MPERDAQGEVEETRQECGEEIPAGGEERGTGSGERLISVYDQQPEGYEGTCLRPMGKCEMGGCCDVCLHNPDHPRFKT